MEACLSNWTNWWMQKHAQWSIFKYFRCLNVFSSCFTHLHRMPVDPPAVLRLSFAWSGRRPPSLLWQAGRGCGTHSGEASLDSSQTLAAVPHSGRYRQSWNTSPTRVHRLWKESTGTKVVQCYETSIRCCNCSFNINSKPQRRFVKERHSCFHAMYYFSYDVHLPKQFMVEWNQLNVEKIERASTI